VRYNALLDQLLTIFNDAIASVHDGAPMSAIDRHHPEGNRCRGYPGQHSHPVGHGVGARAHEPPYSHQLAPERCRRAWCGLSNLEFNGRAAEACVWKTISWDGETGVRSFARIRTIFVAEK